MHPCHGMNQYDIHNSSGNRHLIFGSHAMDSIESQVHLFKALIKDIYPAATAATKARIYHVVVN